MKKFFAVVTVLTMLFALCVPAFAAETAVDITTDGGTAEVIVKTDTKIDTDDDGIGDKDAENFKVTIPADATIPWGTADTVTTLSYFVESHLGYGKHLTVAVTNDGTNTMKYTVGGESLPLAYTLGGEKNFDTVVPVAYDTATKGGVQKDITISITGDAWNTAVVGKYADTLTFTVTVLP